MFSEWLNVRRTKIQFFACVEVEISKQLAAVNYLTGNKKIIVEKEMLRFTEFAKNIFANFVIPSAEQRNCIVCCLANLLDNQYYVAFNVRFFLFNCNVHVSLLFDVSNAL